VIAPARYGGLERVVQSLAEGQRRAGIESRLLVILDAGEPPEGHPFVTGLGPDISWTAVSLPARAYRRERAAVRALCREWHPTVVHTHGARVDVVDAPAARALGIPTVTTVHGFTGGGWKNHLYEWLQRRSFRRMAGVVAVSRPQADALRRRLPPDRVELIPNAWDGRTPAADRGAARRALGLPQEGFIVGWVGRLSEEKGPDLLLRALARLPNGSVHAAMVGDGAERSVLQVEAQRLGLRPHITWCGAVPDAGRWFRAFDVFVLSSRTEGVPVVLFEAMAADVPIVATRVGGVPDVLGESEAYLVAPNDVSALAGAVGLVRGDAELAAARARAARARLERDFANAPWVARYARVYRRAMRARSES